MNENKQNNNNRPGGNQPGNQNQNQNKGQQQLPQKPSYQALGSGKDVMPQEESMGQKYVSIAIIAFLLGFGAAALWFGDGSSSSSGSNATSTGATSTTSTMEEGNTKTGSMETTPSTGTKTGTSMETTPSTGSTSGTSGTGGSMTRAFVVNNQPAGIHVYVASITLDTPAWLAVTEPVEGGVRILGAKLVDRGTHTNVNVELLRGTTAGNRYDVVLRSDNGDHAFDPKVDTPITSGASETIVSVPFTAQ